MPPPLFVPKSFFLQMRPRTKRAKRSTVLWIAALLFVVLVVFFVVWGTANRNDAQTTTSLTPALDRPPAESKVSLAPLLKKVRLFMFIHNISMNQSLPEPAVDAISSSETTKYVRQCVTNPDATPESVLMYHFNASAEGELATFNAEAERELLDDGYAEHVTRSEKFWDPMHSIRRGYGTEGSIFVAIPFAAAAQEVYEVPQHPPTSIPTAESEYVHAKCASTVRSVFTNARWPIGVSVATPQLMFTRLIDGGANRTVERIIHCRPPEFGSPSEEENYGFSFKDNMRSRSVVIPLPSGRPATDTDISQSSMHFSPSHSMRFALMQLYRGESYVLFTNPGIVLTPGWDWSTKLMYLQLPDRGRAVLTNRGTNMAQALVETYLAVLENPDNGDAGVPVNAKVASTALTQLKTVVDSDIFTLTRMVIPTWLYTHLEKVTGADVADPNAESTLPSSLSGMVTALRALVSTVGAHTDDSGVALFTMTQPSLSPGWVLEVVGRQSVFPNTLPEVCAASSEAEWLVGDRDIHKARLECAWLLNHQAQFRRVLSNRLGEWAFTNVAAASTPQHGHTDATELVGIWTSAVGRQSHSLRDMRYMRPAQKPSTMPIATEMWTVRQSHQGSTANGFPYIAELTGSTDFLFTRAEAFVEYKAEDMLRFDPNRSEPPAAAVKLDPFLGLVSRNEEDFFLSAKLWTNGWNLFAPTEAIAFAVELNADNSDSVRASTANEHPDGQKKWGTTPNFMQELRDRTVTRWRRFFTCVPDTSSSCVDDLDGAAFAAGTARSISDYLKWTAVTVN